LIAEAIAYEGKPLSQIVAEVVAEAGGPLFNRRIDLHLDNAHKQTVMRTYTEQPPTSIAGIAVKSVNPQDGVKFYLEDGSWVLLRASGTEPLIRVYLETHSAEQLKTLGTTMESAIEALK
jgi:phosphomannomutase